MGEASAEDFLTKKMEEMRKKNEEILKRYQEVEQDKMYADQFSNSAKEKRKNMDPEKMVPRASTVRTPRNRMQPTESQSNNSPKEMEEKRHHRFSESDGPPPDPNYNFLSDRSRVRNDSSSEENWRNTERNSNSWGQSRRHRTNYGGSDFGNVKSTMEKHKSCYKRNQADSVPASGDLTMQMTGRQRIQYEEWKKEREKVDQARINRQRSSDGSWRREWDSHKNFNDNNKSGDEEYENEKENPHHSFQYQNATVRDVDPNSRNRDFSQRSRNHSANDDVERITGNGRIFRPSGKSSRFISDGDGRLCITLANDIKHPKVPENKEAVSGKLPQRKKTEVSSPRAKSSSWTFLVSEPSSPPPVASHSQMPKPLYPGWQTNSEKGNFEDHSHGNDQKVNMHIGMLSQSQADLPEKFNILSSNEIKTTAKVSNQEFVGTGNMELPIRSEGVQYDSDIYYSDSSPEKLLEVEILRSAKPSIQEVKCRLADLKITEDDDEWEDVSEEEVDGSCSDED